MRLQDFLAELKRRRVFRVAAVYAAMAFVVAQVADLAFPALQLPAWTVTLVVALAILGFPLAIALAWVFDVGPEGIERTAERRSEAPPPTPPPAETAAANPSGALAQTAPAPPPAQATPTPASVAVLPFVDLSPEKDQEYFSDGLTEELLNVLAQVPGLRVPARTSSFAFKGKNTNIEEIGQILKVRTVLEGSVRTWKNQLVITAQLIEVENGYHLWSDTYDRRLEDVFAVQREIARSIVQTLKGKLLRETETPEVKEATTDPEAYQLYLRGWHFYNRFSAENAHKALALFEQATQRDSTFARAWTGLAATWTRLAYLGALPAVEALRQARTAAERALELDPELAEGYAARGLIVHYARDFATAERDLRRALELNPGAARVQNALGVLLTELCRPDEAIVAYRRAAEPDPLWSAPLNNLGSVYTTLGRYVEALAAYEQALELNPTSPELARNVIGVLARLGRHVEAIARARDVRARHPDSQALSTLAECLLLAGQREEAEALLVDLEGLHAEGKTRALDLVSLYALMGRHNAAFAALEQAVAADEPAATQLTTEPAFDPLREDLRWEPLLATAGFPEDAIRRSRELYERRKAAAPPLPETEHA